MTTVTIASVTTPDDLADLRQLCWEYRDFLLHHAPVEAEITRTFYPKATYETVMTALPDLHARPHGIMLLARLDGVAVGCGMTQKLDGQTAEIKRVFIQPAARGKSIARTLCQTLITQARSDGFDRVVLDTSSGLHAAQALYENLGFTARGPYQPIPDAVLPHLRFYEKSL